VQRRFGAAFRRLLPQHQQEGQGQQKTMFRRLFQRLFQRRQPDYQEGLQWCAANRVFVDGRVLTLSAAYLALLKEHYGDSSRLVQAIDFGAAEEAAQVGRRSAFFLFFII
jgi:hypothetical protein